MRRSPTKFVDGLELCNACMSLVSATIAVDEASSKLFSGKAMSGLTAVEQQILRNIVTSASRPA